MAWFGRVRIVVTLVAFCIWFGGFGFYAAVVVPAGTDEFGAFEQARVTRPVSHVLQWLCAGMTLLLAGDWWTERRRTSPRLKRVSAGTIVILLVGLASTFWLHPRINAQIDWTSSDFPDYDRFYLLHRLYLLTLTAQWLAAFTWLVTFVTRGPKAPEIQARRASE